MVAVLTASRATCDAFHQLEDIDDVICVLSPCDFRAVGLWYKDFGQTSDKEVRMLLQQAREREHIEG